MRNAIILHGMPSKEEYYNPDSQAQSNKHWLPWIQRKLILNDILAQALELPEPFEPVYDKWREIIEQVSVDQETILIGHSCGGGFLVRWLSENKVRVGKVVLVAPFLDPDGDEVKSGFFDFTIDEGLVERTAGISILVCRQDDEEILKSVDQIHKALPCVRVVEIPEGRHFTYRDMKKHEFPELLDQLKPF